MKEKLLGRALVVLAVVALAAFFAAPPEEKINLGLDLQGGMYLVMEVQTDDAVRSEADLQMNSFVDRLKEEGLVGATGLRPEGGPIGSFEVRGVRPEQESTLRDLYNRYFGQGWKLGRRGDAFLVSMEEFAIKSQRDQAVEQALKTINTRIDAFGVAEPVIQRQGTDRIVLQLPGVDDPERVKELISKTAFLEFRLSEFPRAGGGVPSREAILANYPGGVPETAEIKTGPITGPDGEVTGTQYYLVEKRSVLTGRDLKDARQVPGEFNDPVVQFTFSYDKGEVFADVTGANVGRGLAILLDDQVVSAPVIQSQIGQTGVIRGNFTPQEAQDLATSLRSGALPAELVELEQRTVGPSLGQDSIDQGLRAGLYGAGLVVLLMLLIYRLAGFNAVFVLTLNVVLVFGFLAALKATLTLPGIAGIILTIGMAVDANVLIFERIREELRAGRTVKSAVHAGFDKALSSILDANVTTFIAAVFLFNFGTGPIRGFAVTLSVGILASFFTALFVSRLIFDAWLSRRQRVERISI